MPIRPEPYEGEQVLPWLMNLLPEGEPLRAITRALGAAPEDALGLIAQTGNDLAGALSIAPQQPRGEPGYRPIPDAGALERIIEELPARPYLVGEDGVSMSLAGAQEKLPVAIIDGQIAVPINGAPSTHILKPDNPRLPGSVQNEALCMVLARRIGLNVAPVTTGVAGERSYLLVERYDRTGTGNSVRRLHQHHFSFRERPGNPGSTIAPTELGHSPRHGVEERPDCRPVFRRAGGIAGGDQRRRTMHAGL